MSGLRPPVGKMTTSKSTGVAQLFPERPEQLGLFEAFPATLPVAQKRSWVRQGKPNLALYGIHLEDALEYLAATNSLLHDHPEARHNPKIGIMANPDNGAVPGEILAGRHWGTDNGAYSGRFDPEVYHQWLSLLSPRHATCRFAVAPDVVGNWSTTLDLFSVWARTIRSFGFPAAVVAHRGCTPEGLPDADCLFVPASNLDDPLLPLLLQEAKRRKLWLHLGRVNSLKRMKQARLLGFHSADGTYLKHRGVDWGLHDISRWVWGSAAVLKNRPLFRQGLQVVRYREMPSDHDRLRERRREGAKAAGEELLDRVTLMEGMSVFDFVTGYKGNIVEVPHATTCEVDIQLENTGFTVSRMLEQLCTLKHPSHLPLIQKATLTTGLDVDLLDDLDHLDPTLCMDDHERTEWENDRTFTPEDEEWNQQVS